MTAGPELCSSLQIDAIDVDVGHGLSNLLS